MEMTRQLFFTINCIGLYDRFLPIYPASRSNATASARAATVRGAALCALLLALVFLTGCRGFSATGGPGPLVKNSLATWQDPSFAPQKINQVVVMPLEGEIYRSLPRDVQDEIFAELNRSFGLHTSLEILTTEKHVKAVTRSGPQVQRAAIWTANRRRSVGGPQVRDFVFGLSKVVKQSRFGQRVLRSPKNP